MRPARELLRDPTVWLGVLVALGVAGAVASEGPNIWHDVREQRRVDQDPHVRGRVVALTDTGEDNHGEPLVEVTVAFTTLEGSAIVTRTLERLRAPDVAVLSHHPELDVWYDPKTPASAVIRWRPSR